MSASEKLGRLGKPWWSDFDTDKVLSAWPQILELVEAAEQVRGMGDWVTQTRLPAALDALDEQLGEHK